MRADPRAVGVVLACSLAVSSVAGRGPTAQVWASDGPTTLHPWYPWTPTDRRFHALIHESVFEPDGRGGWRSDLVASLEREGDEARLVLERDLRWSDGERITGADLCATLARLADLQRPTPFTAGVVARVVSCTPGAEPSEVSVTLQPDTPDARAALAVPLVPAHTSDLLEATHASPMLDGVVGAGPFSAEPGRESWTLQTTAPGLGVRSLEWIEGQRPAINTRAFLSGEGDGVLDVPAGLLSEVRASNTILHVDPQLVVWSLALNTSLAPLDDVRVRQALDLLIDREALRDRWAGQVPDGARHPWRPVSGPFPPDSEWSNRSVPVVERDEARAFELLTASGLQRGDDGRWQHDGEPWQLQLVVPGDQGIDGPAAAAALDEQLTGISLQITEVGPTQWWFSVLAGGHNDDTALVLVPRSLTPDPDPSAWFQTRTDRSGWHNVFGFSHPDADAACRTWHSTRRTDAAHDLHALLADERPHLFLLAAEGRHAWRPHWTTVIASPGDLFARFREWRRAAP